MALSLGASPPAQFVLAAQSTAGNQAAAALVARHHAQSTSASTQIPTVQRDYEPLRHRGVLDNGIVNRELVTQVNGIRRTLQPGTYVEVLQRSGSDRLHVRVWSGHHGGRATIPVSSFQPQPQVDDRRNSREARIGGTRDDIGYRPIRSSIPVPLWASSGPDYRDVRQIGIGDCYLLAAAAGIALADPARIRHMFPITEPGLPRYTVVLNRPRSAGQPVPPSGEREIVTVVDAHMPRLLSGTSFIRGPEGMASAFGVHRQPAPREGQQPSAELVSWPFFLEKAIAQVLGGYDDLGEGGEFQRENRIYQLLTGRSLLQDNDWVAGSGLAADWRQMSDSRLLETLHRRLARGDVVTCATTLRFAMSPPGTGLVPAHQYTLVSVNRTEGTLRLRNPWGRHDPNILDVNQFRAGISHISYGDLAEDLAHPPGRRSQIPTED